MKKFLITLASLCGLALMLVPALASADVNDFTVTSFAADETLSRNDRQGELHIVERINVDFHDFNHGILRAIPERYKGHSLQLHINEVSSTSGASSQYSTYHSNGNTVLQIGSPSKTITGPQQYTIDYTARNVIGFYDDHDELYWDVNGDQWAQTFENVSLSLHLPDGLQLASAPLCYAGYSGQAEGNCLVNKSFDGYEIHTIGNLTSNQTLTYVASFDKEYFQPSAWYETLGEYSRLIGGILLPLLIIGGSAWWKWWRGGRDAKGRGVIVPQYDAPNGLKPMEVGALINFKVGTTEITASIIDLAIRRYIKIIEEKQDRALRKDTLNYKLQLLNNDLTQLNPQETSLIHKLFPDLVVGAEIDISSSKNKLYTLVGKLNSQVVSKLKADGYLLDSKNPARHTSHAGLKLLAGLIVLIVCFVAFGVFTFIGIGLGISVLVFFMIFMDARTALGVQAKEHILGLKKYLNTAEKDRIEKLQAPDAAYAANSAAPVKTVELFEKLLPYAMVLGVEKQWATQFESLYTQPPDWYSGNFTNFNAYYLASSLNSGVGSAVNSAFSAPSSSGSSGSGGGFSGGGGGGGGGGGW